MAFFHDAGKSMVQVVSEALVLRVWPFHEADLLVSLFTREHGRVRGVARHAMKSRRRFGGALEPMTHVRAAYVEKRGQELVRLDGFEIVSSPLSGAIDYQRTAALQLVAEVLEEAMPDGAVEDSVFRLAVAVLEQVRVGRVWLPVTYFCLWMNRLLGWMPDLGRCAVCGVGLGEGAWYSETMDGVTCADDRRGGSTALPVEAMLLAGRMFRGQVADLALEEWPRRRGAELRRFAFGTLERHLEARFASARALERGGTLMFRPIVRRCGLVVLALAGCGCGLAQETGGVTTLKAGASLVLVPVEVRTKGGEPVFTLTAKDFVVTDDGVPQVLRLEEDAGSQPLALVVVVEDGGDGAGKLEQYGTLGTMIDALVGGVEHRVAVVAFDSEAEVVQPFTEDVDKVNKAIHGLMPGDGGGAILDGVGMAVEILGRQPQRYRRAMLLVSETVDHGSHTSLDAAIRRVSDTNTVIYGLGFSSTRAENKHELAEMSGGAGSRPGPEHGCMGEQVAVAGLAKQSKAAQAYDCLSDLLPPLRLAKMALIAARNGFKTNVPETAAKLTGGEYFKFENAKGLEKGLQAISNRLPNRYFLSFQPVNPHEGLHALGVALPEYTGLKVEARNSYWAAAK